MAVNGVDTGADERATVDAARELIDLGADAFFGTAADRFVELVGRIHPARDLHVGSTAEAIRRCGLPDAETAAAAVFANFLWTHFVCKLLMTAAPAATASFIADHLDTDAAISSLEETGASILSCFHYVAYPLVALGLAMSPAAPLLSKARVDVLDQSGAAGSADHVVYASSPSAAIQLTRALRRGRSVWVLLDVVLPGVRVVAAEFLGQRLEVGAGLGKIARLSRRPCLPISWAVRPQGTPLRAASPVRSEGRSEQEIIQDFVSTQAAFIGEQPTEWLEWYSLLEEAPRLRAQVKQGNDEVWRHLGGAFR